MVHNDLRAGDRSPALRLRQGHGACTLLAAVIHLFSFINQSKFCLKVAEIGITFSFIVSILPSTFSI
jgi:hypothetical protein